MYSCNIFCLVAHKWINTIEVYCFTNQENLKQWHVLKCSLTIFPLNVLQLRWHLTGKGHYYENQNVEKQPKRTSKISVFLVHHYYKNQNVEKNEKNIENLNFVWFSHFNYLWRHFNYLWHMVLWTTGIKNESLKTL